MDRAGGSGKASLRRDVSADLEEVRGQQAMVMPGKSIPGRGNSMCKGLTTLAGRLLLLSLEPNTVLSIEAANIAGRTTHWASEEVGSSSKPPYGLA